MSETGVPMNLSALDRNLSEMLSDKEFSLRDVSSRDMDDPNNLLAFQSAFGEWQTAMQMSSTIVKAVTDAHRQIIQSMA